MKSTFLLILSAFLISLFGCNPDHPEPSKVKVWIEQKRYDNGGELWTYTYILHFDRKIESAATVSLRYMLNVNDLPNVAGAGGRYIIEKKYQYNVDSDSAMITTTELANPLYVWTCDLQLLGISDQVIGRYTFEVDNSMHPSCGK